MSTVESINFYFDLKGISEDVTLVQDSQDVDLIRNYVTLDTISNFGSFFVFARNGEVLNIWGISGYIPWNDSYVEMIYSASQQRKAIARQQKKSVHYIAMAGLSGYMPNYCASHDSYSSAVDDLATLHELSQRKTRILRRDGYVDLDLHKHGNEYAEITECDCDDPSQHNDN